MSSTISIRDAYQILRDRFANKTRRKAIYDVSLTENSICVLNATINGMTSFVNTYTENEELINEITTIFDDIFKQYTNKGYSVSYGKPSLDFMKNMDELYVKENYLSYFKVYSANIQITILVKE